MNVVIQSHVQDTFHTLCLFMCIYLFEAGGFCWSVFSNKYVHYSGEVGPAGSISDNRCAAVASVGGC